MSNTYYKYEKYLKYINGVPQNEYKLGEIVGEGEYDSLLDCESAVLYRWIDSGETICDGYKLCVKEVKEKSTDKGVTWALTGESRVGTVVNAWASECGYSPIYDWIATGKYTCNNGFDSEEFVYSKSLDGGETWETVEPAQYKYEEKFLSNRCMMDVEPFTFVYNTARPGGSLTMANLISYWGEPTSMSRKFWLPDDNRAVGILVTTRHFYCITKYIIDWGDGSDLEIYEKTSSSSDADTFIEDPGYTYPSEVVGDFKYKNINITSHNYTSDGKYTIKVWGFINDVDIIADELISWGESGITNYTLPPKTFDKASPTGWIYGIVGAEYMDYLRFSDIISLDVIKEFPPLIRTILNKKEFVNDNNPAYPWKIDPPATNPRYKPSRWQAVGDCPRFYLKNCQVTEFDFATEVEAISLIDLPNLTRTPRFVEGLNTPMRIDSYYIANCPSVTKVGPFSPVYQRRTASGGLHSIDFFKMLYKNSPDITEIDFGYCAFSDKENWLRRFNSLTTLKGYLYKSVYPKDDDPIISFAEMFSGNTKLRDISGLTILSGDCTGMFRNNFFITSHCGFDDISNHDPNIHGGRIHEPIIADRMFYNSDIILTVNLDRLVGVTSAESMFGNCPMLKTVIGEYPKGLINMSEMFSGCDKLNSISPIFKNYTGKLPKADYMFRVCPELETIPEDFFNIEGTGYPMGMFANALSLKNYPKINDLPLWEWDRFKYNGQMAVTCCFFGCYYIRTLVPVQWGGATDYRKDYLVIKVKAGTYYNPNKQRPGSVLVMFDAGLDYITPSNDSLVCTSPTRIYVRYAENVDAYLPYTGELPSDIYMELEDPGRFINSFDYFGSSSNYCYGVKEVDGTYFLLSRMYLSTTTLDLAPYSSCNYILEPQNILAGCINVTEIKNFNFYGSHLPTETRQLLLSPIKTLVTIDNFCDTASEACNGDGNVTTTLGLFKNNPNLVSAKLAFLKLPITTLDSDEFDNCTKLENIFGVFMECTSLTNVPTFNGAKNIKDFSYAFSGCTNLTGSTPVDENGYKLWERAGKEGYPATIDGFRCFQGCTQLDDYDEIPSNWK